MKKTENLEVIPSIRRLPAAVARNLLGVFFDIDDTFSTRGKIHVSAYRSLWALRESGLWAAAITGRPAGWCDHIARMWPVDGVVGENGALYFWFDEKERKVKKRFLDPEGARAEKRKRLARIKEEILYSVPGSAVASDQLYRETDLAIDYCEDVKPLDREAVNRICDIFKRHGAQCKVSSIHVNGWFGDYDKLAMTKTFVRERWGLVADANRERFLFCGDSPNDEPMFQYFPVTAGVKNILNFADRMEYLPSFVSSTEGGEGFAEIVEVLLQKRGQVTF